VKRQQRGGGAEELRREKEQRNRGAHETAEVQRARERVEQLSSRGASVIRIFSPPPLCPSAVIMWVHCIPPGKEKLGAVVLTC
jgi:hypothetical protein